MDDHPTITCSITGKEVKAAVTKAGNIRTPRGWKKRGDKYYSPEAWAERYATRVVSVPIAEFDRPEEKYGDKKAFGALVKEASIASTQILNWLTSQYYVRDVERGPNAAEKMPRWETPYLYPEAVARWPHVGSNSIISLIHKAESAWRDRRYHVKWIAKESIRSYRYPQPIYIPSKTFDVVSVRDGERLAVKFSLGSQKAENITRFCAVLRGGAQFARQRAALQQIIDGEAVKAEMKIMPKRVQASTHRAKDSEHDRNGQHYTRWDLQIVGAFPKRAATQRHGKMLLRTCPDAFLEAIDPKEQKIRVWYCRHFLRWQAEHGRRLQEFAHDQKCEQRPHASFDRRRKDAVRKHQYRMDSAIKEVAAQVAGLACRLRFAAVVVDDRNRDYIPSFPYHQLKIAIASRLDAEGIAVEDPPDAL